MVKIYFSINKMYDKKFTLKEILNYYQKYDTSENWSNPIIYKRLKDVYDFLESNFWKCPSCDQYFDDHPLIDNNHYNYKDPECLDCIENPDVY